MYLKKFVIPTFLFQQTRRFFSSNSNDLLISVENAFGLLSKQSKKTVFIDVRDPTIFKTSHIPNSQNINEIFSYLATSDSQGILQLKNTFENLFQNAGITGNETAIFYEDNLKKRFGASCRGAYLLTLFGHKNAKILHGGWDLWVHNKYPTTNQESILPQKGTFKLAWNQQIWADKNDVLNALNDKNTIIVDVRDEEEWIGESSSPYGKDFTPRKGRIPGAKHLFWKELMKEGKDGCTYMEEPQRIKEIAAQKGITSDKNIILYCFKGARASNTYNALKRAEFQNVSNYFASWNEWSRDINCPVDETILDAKKN